MAGGAVIGCYIEAPEDLGDFVPQFDAVELIGVGAPINLKFGLRLRARNPSGRPDHADCPAPRRDRRLEPSLPVFEIPNG